MIGILFCHSQYAYLQETLLGDKSLKLDVALVLCFQYVIAIIVSGTIILLSGSKGGLTEAFTWDDLLVSIFCFASMNFSNRAMKVVSYPFVILCKSAKIIPVIVVGTIRQVYKPDPKQFVVAFLITAGLLIFNFAKMKTNETEHMTGLWMVIVSLLFDGMTQTQTDMQHAKSKRDFAYPAMFTNNCFGLLLSLSIYIYNVVFLGDDTYHRIIND